VIRRSQILNAKEKSTKKNSVAGKRRKEKLSYRRSVLNSSCSSLRSTLTLCRRNLDSVKRFKNKNRWIWRMSTEISSSDTISMSRKLVLI